MEHQQQQQTIAPKGLPARRSGTMCALCNSKVQEGELVFPSAKQPGSRGFRWSHLKCFSLMAPGEWQAPVCRHWARDGVCLYEKEGIGCVFQHPLDLAPHKDEKRAWGGRRRKLKNESKNTVFRIWLLKKFGQENLAAGSGVLDAGGGGGGLAFELRNLNGVPACAVDPRPPDTRRQERKWALGKYGVERAGPLFSRWNPGYAPGKPFVRPNHLRLYFQAEQFAKWRNHLNAVAKNEDTPGALKTMILRNDAELEDWLLQNQTRAQQTVWTTKGLEEHHEEEEPPRETMGGATVPAIGEKAGPERCLATVGQAGGQEEASMTENDGTILENAFVGATEFLELITSCSMIIGLHPDQAAGELVEYCAAFSIPFAVIPCCVYSAQYPKRRIRDAKLGLMRPVKSYEDLIEWIQQTVPQSKVETLNFEGKNKVVYCFDYSTSDDDQKEQAASSC